ncbi:hypothetical protein A4A49_14625 [Nicotiana attenuata]|uniref:Uncharacterized protein n=1 Tax=Nicotiana attenuata TaxID=49451 RepID=A0A1J6IM39_NICAT|nr:hypothetical protein A4A49_14625 [Nicotiana attenuata]
MISVTITYAHRKMGRGRPAKNAKKVKKEEVKLAEGRSATMRVNITPKSLLIQKGETLLTAPMVLMEAVKIKAITPIGSSGMKELENTNEGSHSVQKMVSKGKEQMSPNLEIWHALPVRAEGTKTPMSIVNTPATMRPATAQIGQTSSQRERTR